MIVPGSLSGAIYSFFGDKKKIYRLVLREMRMQLSPLSIKGISGMKPMRMKINRQEWRELRNEVKRMVRNTQFPDHMVREIQQLNHEKFPKN